MLLNNFLLREKASKTDLRVRTNAIKRREDSFSNGKTRKHLKPDSIDTISFCETFQSSLPIVIVHICEILDASMR